MDIADLHLDGNGVAGILGEIFTTMEITSAERICQSCGTRAAMGAHRAYQGAGIVLRCPHCGDIAALLGLMGDHGHLLELRGRWFLGRST
jgi:ribosomal protein S27AE